jgi:hypothetical protein
LSYPALIAALERARLSDVAAYAAAVRRAGQLSAINDSGRQARAIAQFQGTLAVMARAASRGSVPAATLPGLVSSLAAVDFNERGDYEGKLARWIDANLRNTSRVAAPAQSPGDVDQNAAGPVEADLLGLLSGPPMTTPRFVNWEGTRYRLDLRGAEAARLARLLGDDPRPYLSSAREIAGIADALEQKGLTRDALRQQAGAFEHAAEAVAWNAPDEGESTSDVRDRYRQVAAGLQRASRDGDLSGAPRLAAPLRVCADDLLARGLQELAYAIALGQSDRGSFSAEEASSRHDFGLKINGVGRSGPWRLPVAGSSLTQSWHAIGSLLGLDVALAEFSLVRLSARPPLRRPTLNETDRRVFVEAAALVEPASLTDEDLDAIVSAIGRGRTRLAAVRTAGDAGAIADEIRLSAIRRTLLSWIVAHDPARLTAFLSPAELLWLGLEKMDPRLHAWGAPSEARTGCLCLQMIDRRPSESLSGRWGSGVLATGFPDLNLRLAELLADLRMPAALLGPVLASATLDFVNTATSRDQDDLRGLVEYVWALRRDQVEQYLAFLTTDGPLVPAGEATDAAGARERIGAPR